MVFWPIHGHAPSGLIARMSHACYFVPRQWEPRQPTSLFRTSPDPSRNAHRFTGPPKEGREHPLHLPHSTGRSMPRFDTPTAHSLPGGGSVPILGVEFTTTGVPELIIFVRNCSGQLVIVFFQNLHECIRLCVFNHTDRYRTDLGEKAVPACRKRVLKRPEQLPSSFH